MSSSLPSPSSPNPITDIHEASAVVAAWLRLFFQPGDVTELRCLHVTRMTYKKPHIESGFFDYDHFPDMALEAMRLTDNAKGCYFVMNPLRPEILARCANRVEAARQDALACDKDVLRRNWILVDTDPVRDPLVSATGAEKAAARQVTDAVLAYFRTAGWPEPIQADSGNGYHLFYRVNLSNDDLATKTIRATLQWLGDKFDTKECKVDRKVFNASRIVKLPGTLARKGDHMPDRPHRRAHLIGIPGLDLHKYSQGDINQK